MKAALHRAAIWAERALSRLPRRKRVGRVIDPHLGYATAEALVVRGRVLSRLDRATPQDGQSRLVNLRQSLALFMTQEVADVPVSSGAARTRSDEEGYFTLTLPRPVQPGWHDVPVTIDGIDAPTLCPAMVSRADARFVVISDIDDTMMQTGAYALWRNLWTSLTGNSLTRHVFPDAVALMNRLSAGGRNPVYYVSSSPWNLHFFLQQVFSRTGLTRGPMFLRDLGVSDSQFISGTHGDHKGGSIDTILAAVPDLPVILIGDTGQHDAEVYRDAVGRHPGRIKAVVLRVAGSDVKPATQAAMTEIEGAGVRMLQGRDYTGMVPEDLVG